MGTPQGVEPGHERSLVLETGIDKIHEIIIKLQVIRFCSIDDLSFCFVTCLNIQFLR